MNAQPNLGIEVTTFENPMGVTASSSSSSRRPTRGTLHALFEQARLHRGRAAPLEGRSRCIARATSTSSSTKSRALRGRLRRRARPVRVRVRVSRQEARTWVRERARARRAADRRRNTRPWTRRGDQGHRRRPLYLIDRFGEDGDDLRHRLRVPARRRPPSGRPRPHLHRPPHAQRLRRPHGVVGGLLRAPLQLPRDPLLRHQGREDRPHLEGDDRAGRQDPHPAQRGVGPKGRRSRNTSTQYHGEGIQHIALLTDDIFATVDSCARRRASSSTRPTRYYDMLDARVPGHGEDVRAPEARTRSCSTARQGNQAAPAAADLHRERARPDLLRVHPAQGQRRLRRGQLQGAVRIDRARPDAPRRARANWARH